MGQMRVLCEKGDITIEWDAEDADSVAKARAEWDSLKAAGYEFFRADERGKAKPKRVKRFSKKLGSVLAAPGVKKPEDKKAGTRPKAMAGGPNARIIGMPAPQATRPIIASNKLGGISGKCW